VRPVPQTAFPNWRRRLDVLRRNLSKLGDFEDIETLQRLASIAVAPTTRCLRGIRFQCVQMS